MGSFSLGPWPARGALAVLAMVLILGLTPGAGGYADSAPGKAPGVSARAAEPAYRQLCAGCHGPDGRGKPSQAGERPPSNFTSHAWQAARTDARLLAGILNGKGDEMPAFADRVTPAQARDLVALIRAFDATPLKSASFEVDDFDRKWEDLQRRWRELNRQMDELVASHTKAK